MFFEVTATDVFKLIKHININKVTGEDQILPTLMKTADNFLVELFTDINSCFNTSTFPDLAKRASVTPIDKGGTDKHSCTNYSPLSVLNTFSKIIKSSRFDQLTNYANEFLQTYCGTYYTAVNIF